MTYDICIQAVTLILTFSLAYKTNNIHKLSILCYESGIISAFNKEIVLSNNVFLTDHSDKAVTLEYNR